MIIIIYLLINYNYKIIENHILIKIVHKINHLEQYQDVNNVKDKHHFLILKRNNVQELNI